LNRLAFSDLFSTHLFDASLLREESAFALEEPFGLFGALLCTHPITVDPVAVAERRVKLRSGMPHSATAPVTHPARDKARAASSQPGARPGRRAPDARDQTGLGRRPELRLVEEHGC
jgi:hypothetical protein